MCACVCVACCAVGRVCAGAKGKLWGKVRNAVDEGHQAVSEKPRLVPDLHRRRAAMQRKREVGGRMGCHSSVVARTGVLQGCDAVEWFVLFRGRLWQSGGWRCALCLTGGPKEGRGGAEAV